MKATGTKSLISVPGATQWAQVLCLPLPSHDAYCSRINLLCLHLHVCGIYYEHLLFKDDGPETTTSQRLYEKEAYELETFLPRRCLAVTNLSSWSSFLGFSALPSPVIHMLAL